MDRKVYSPRLALMWALLVAGALTVGAAVAVGQTPPVDAQRAPDAGSPHACAMMSGGGMMGGQHQMMANQKAMMAKMQAGDQTLAELVTRMNAARGDDKVAAMAAVINELVAQRSAMRQMMQMQAAEPAPVNAAPESDHSAHHPAK